jgi:hypothetical protein
MCLTALLSGDEILGVGRAHIFDRRAALHWQLRCDSPKHQAYEAVATREAERKQLGPRRSQG